MLPLLLTVVALAALTLVLLPLLRGARAAPERGSFDRAVYRDQLAELDRDIARGVLTEQEAVGARLEIQRRLLAAAAPNTQAAGEAAQTQARAQAGAQAQVRARARSPLLAGALALLVAAGAGGLYARLGSPGVPDEPYASRPPDAVVSAGNQHVDLRQAAERLGEKLAADPNHADGWLLYARTEAMLGDWDKAAAAYRRALALGEAGAEAHAGYGEMLVMQAQGMVTPAARDAFLATLKADPNNDVARYYLALAAGQAGEPQKAIDMLQALAADLPADSPMREAISRREAEAAQAGGLPVPKLAASRASAPAPGPDAATMEAAAQMPEADRKTMIQGMVDKLAARLQTEPKDRDGWLRLGRAYGVLGERDKAADAYEKAAALQPGDVSILLQELDALLTGLKPEDALPPRAVALLRKLQLVAPDEPEVLWYRGVVAAREGHPEDARQSWTRLLAKLPAEGDDAKLVKAALAQVK